MKNGIERISQAGHCAEASDHSLLEEASHVARSVSESIQALAGTTHCKGVQINELRKFAQRGGCWIADPTTLGIFSDRGSENEVYLANNNLDECSLSQSVTTFFGEIGHFAIDYAKFVSA